MSQKIVSLVEQLRSGKTRALARVISIIEDDRPERAECLKLLYPHTGNCHCVGVTGAPGVGKSTLVDGLVRKLAENKKVGVLAVDPSSPYTGGAVLGDRIRMAEASALENVFIRSMATRGALGGISPRTAEAIFALDSAGYRTVFVETVGVGQAEVDIVKHSDTVLVVLVPGMGDGVQALKAGIIEIADIFVINKADYSGKDRLRKELTGVLGLVDGPQPEIIETVASTGEGIPELLAALERHRLASVESGDSTTRKETFLRQTLNTHLGNRVRSEVTAFAEANGLLEEALGKIRKREEDPISAAESILQAFYASMRATK